MHRGSGFLPRYRRKDTNNIRNDQIFIEKLVKLMALVFFLLQISAAGERWRRELYV